MSPFLWIGLIDADCVNPVNPENSTDGRSPQRNKSLIDTVRHS